MDLKEWEEIYNDKDMCIEVMQDQEKDLKEQKEMYDELEKRIYELEEDNEKLKNLIDSMEV